MSRTPLRARVSDDREALDILNSELPNTEAARRLTLAGIAALEASVRRYRASQKVRKPRNGLTTPEVSSPSRGPGSEALSRSASRRHSAAPLWSTGSDVDYVSGTAEIRTAPRPVSEIEPGEAELLRAHGFDPELWEVTAARRSIWEVAGYEEPLTASRVSVCKRSALAERVPEPAELSLLADYTPLITAAQLPETYEGTLVVALGNLQVGKSNEKRGGTNELVGACAGDDDLRHQAHHRAGRS